LPDDKMKDACMFWFEYKEGGPRSKSASLDAELHGEVPPTELKGLQDLACATTVRRMGLQKKGIGWLRNQYQTNDEFRSDFENNRAKFQEDGKAAADAGAHPQAVYRKAEPPCATTTLKHQSGKEAKLERKGKWTMYSPAGYLQTKKINWEDAGETLCKFYDEDGDKEIDVIWKFEGIDGVWELKESKIDKSLKDENLHSSLLASSEREMDQAARIKSPSTSRHPNQLQCRRLLPPAGCAAPALELTMGGEGRAGGPLGEELAARNS
jgi:hypothetical protein